MSGPAANSVPEFSSRMVTPVWLNVMRAHMPAINAKIEESNAALDSLKAEHAEAITTLQSEANTHKTDLASRTTELESVKAELDRFRAELDAARAKAVDDAETAGVTAI